ncbi:MAG: hypothetical protein WD403_10255 [Pirellulales bacterium]
MLRRTAVVLIMLGVCCPAVGALAAGPARVSFELATEQGFPAAATQQWYTLLTDLDVDGLRIRAARAGDQPAIEATGGAASPFYRVTGLLSARNELVLPGGKFSVRDRAKLHQWLTRLREDGPEHAQARKPLPFGLSSAELAAAHKDLARPVAVSTAGLKLSEALDKIAAGLDAPLVAERAAAAALGRAEQVSEDVQGISSGTALAYLLRAEGLALEPRRDARRQVEYAVKLPAEGQPVWPVGWPPEVKPAELRPELFEFLNAEIDDVPLSETLKVIGERLDLPILFDHHALVREGIDIHEVKVSLPPRRTFYDKVLRTVLSQALLTSEMRVDEAGKPLLWVTTLKRK